MVSVREYVWAGVVVGALVGGFIALAILLGTLAWWAVR